MSEGKYSVTNSNIIIIDIFAAVAVNPYISRWQIVYESDINSTSVARILPRYKLR